MSIFAHCIIVVKWGTNCGYSGVHDFDSWLWGLNTSSLCLQPQMYSWKLHFKNKFVKLYLMIGLYIFCKILAEIGVFRVSFWISIKIGLVCKNFCWFSFLITKTVFKIFLYFNVEHECRPLLFVNGFGAVSIANYKHSVFAKLNDFRVFQIQHVPQQTALKLKRLKQSNLS